MRFSIRDLLCLTALVAVAVACLVDHGNLATAIEDRNSALERVKIEAESQKLQEEFVRKQQEALKQRNEAEARRLNYFQGDGGEIGIEGL